MPFLVNFLPYLFWFLQPTSATPPSVDSHPNIQAQTAKAPANQADFCNLYGAVYVEQSAAMAQYNVFVEKTEAFADLLVFKEPNSAFADQSGLWYFTKYRAEANFSICFVRHAAHADFTIAYTTAATFAGCR